MAKSLNFNNVAKRYLTVTLADEKNTTIMVAMPTKGLLREVIDIKSNVDTSATGDNFGALDELYTICAKAMSRNKGGVTITKEYLEDIFDFEDVLIFLKEYMSFIGEIAGRKN